MSMVKDTGTSTSPALPARARVVVIGGGAVGASVAYHLAVVRGEPDVLLLERDELTSGSTWHAAGNVPTFSSDAGMLGLQKYSTELYTRLAADPEHPIAYHRTGALRLARTPDRLDEFRRVAAMTNARRAAVTGSAPARGARAVHATGRGCERRPGLGPAM